MTAPTGDGPAGLVVALLDGTDGPGRSDDWARRLLSAVERLPTEQYALGARAAAAVLEAPVAEAARARARMLVAYNARPIDRGALAATCEELAQAGNPAAAALGLNRLGRYARVAGLRPVGELIHLAGLAVVDLCSGVPPLPYGPALAMPPGGGPVAAAWTAACALDGPALAVVLNQASADPALVPPGHVAAESLRAAERVVASAALGTPPPDDPDWVRMLCLRGVAFSLPAGGEARFPAYVAYTRMRAVTAEGRVAVAERYAQALMMTGRIGEAGSVLDDARRDIKDAGSPPGPLLTVMRSYARMWRIAGDPQKALGYSDQVVALVTGRDSGAFVATQLGGAWLNRAAVLRAAGRDDEAYEAAVRSHEAYARDELLLVGQMEAQQYLCRCDPDRVRAVARARAVLDVWDAGQMPHPVRSSTLWAVGDALAGSHPALALRAYRDAAREAYSGRRLATTVQMDAARLLLRHRDAALDPDRTATDWARGAVAAAEVQSNRLLLAQSRLLLARCLWEDGDPAGAAAVGRLGLDDVTATVSGLTSEGAQDVVARLREDLTALFDAAVATDDGELAVRVAEAGRGLRLAAMIRLDAEALPPSVREALAAAAAANRAEEGDGTSAGPLDGDQTRSVRAMAGEELRRSRAALDRLCGSVLRDIATDGSFDPTAVRDDLPTAHLVTLAETDGVLRWTWWAPGAAGPAAGRQPVPDGARQLLAAYARGTAASVPGDVSGPIRHLLPTPLLRHLAEAGAVQDVLLSPTGRLWHAPFLAAPLPGAAPGQPPRRLVHAARVTLAPSLRLAQAVAARDRAASSAARQAPLRLQAYCNPDLAGAQAEKLALTEHWPVEELDGVPSFGADGRVDMAVVSTHADSTPGLGQAIVDHESRRLTAGECLLRTFPRTVVLGSCHGYGAADDQAGDGADPIGLLTVIAARGTTWAIGGHQRVDDATAGWILSRVYRRLAAGEPLGDALRASQIAYLTMLERAAQDAAGALPDALAAAVGDRTADALDVPWCWALTIVGPPASPATAAASVRGS